MTSQVSHQCSRARHFGLHSIAMVLGRTLAAWLWLAIGTLSCGLCIMLVAPFDPSARARWLFVHTWAWVLSTIMGLKQLDIAGVERLNAAEGTLVMICLLYTSPSPRDR